MNKCKCGNKQRRGQRYCLKCHAAYMRRWNKSHPLSDEARFKANARAYTHTYVKRGKIKKLPCRVCGKKAEAHHTDYFNPLDVDWLCRKHHLALHSA